MGLLSRAINIEKKKDNKKGLLWKADSILKNNQGLLKKAEEMGKKGLLKKAELISFTMGKGKGLLEQAEEIEKSIKGLLARAEEIKEKSAGETGVVEMVEEEGIPEVEEESLAEEVVYEKEIIREKAEEIPSEEEKKLTVSDSERCVRYLEEKKILQLIKKLNRGLKEKGYEWFFNLILEVVINLEKGKSGALYILLKGRFKPVVKLMEKGKKFDFSEKGFGKNSPLIRYLLKESEHPLRYEKIKKEALEIGTEDFDPLSPWTIFPLVSEGEVFGFIIVGNRQKRGGPAETIMLFSQIASPYVAGYSLKEFYIQKMYKLEKNLEEKNFLLDLYLPLEPPESMEEAFKRFCNRFAINCALALTGWGKHQKIIASEGLPEDVLKKYRLPSNDRSIKSIIKNNFPDVPSDYENRIEKLFKKDKELANNFIVLPVNFQEELLLVIVIHNIKGTGKKLATSIKKKLMHGARSMIPYYLYSR